MRLRLRRLTGAWAVAGWLVASPCLADKVAILPFLSTSAATSSDLDGARAATRAAATSLSHRLPADGEMLTAQMASKDGVADTGEEYRAAGRASTSDWTVVGHLEGHGATYRLELDVCQVQTGRIESLAREITPAQAPAQIAEMLTLLLRPEGLANAAIPWERGGPQLPTPVAAPPTQPTPAPPVIPPPATTVTPATEPTRVYAQGHPFSLGLGMSALDAFARPSNATGSAMAGTVGVSGGYALSTAPGLELRAELDVSVAGPRSVTVGGGARYAFPLIPSLRLYAGPEVMVGGFFASGADKTARALVQGAGFVALGLTDHVQLEVSGDLAYAAGSPSLGLGAGTLRALVRF